MYIYYIQAVIFCLFRTKNNNKLPRVLGNFYHFFMDLISLFFGTPPKTAFPKRKRKVSSISQYSMHSVIEMYGLSKPIRATEIRYFVLLRSCWKKRLFCCVQDRILVEQTVNTCFWWNFLSSKRLSEQLNNWWRTQSLAKSVVDSNTYYKVSVNKN